MGKLIIKREKVMIGFAVKMKCYVNGKVICELKNGEEVSCEVSNEIIEFKCNTASNPMSDTVVLDMRNRDALHIFAKQGSWKALVSVLEDDAILEQKSSSGLASRQTNTVANNVFFAPTKKVGSYFAINENTKQFAIGKGLLTNFKNSTIYDFDDIIDFELLEDGTTITKGGLGRATVGGLLFGGVGAIVGGVTGGKKASTKCTSLQVKITVNNINAPAEYIKLISSTVDKKSSLYKAAYQNAQEILSLLQLICSQRETDNPVGSTNTPVQDVSAADEIRKFKALMEEGIITEEEFLAKKKQLLGL